MDILKGNVKSIYLKYLASAFGSALISSIYGIVDMAMVGNYHGPEGSAAMGVFAPIWNIIYSFGLLAGIGGSVLFSEAKGKEKGESKKANEYFTAAIIFGLILPLITSILIIFFGKPLLYIFGADDNLFLLAEKYLEPIKYTAVFFIFTQLISAFLRNDNNPGLATAAVLFGGIFNIFGDWFFVFYLDLGIYGAGLATSLGAVLSLLLSLTHFLKKKCTLCLVKPKKTVKLLKDIAVVGFPTCITDIAMGIMTVLFNRQIMQYLGTDALSVYAVIINISTFVQCCAYSVGQASQPIFSINFGAGKYHRIKECFKYSVITSFAFGIIWTAVSLLFPEFFVYLFMTPTESVLRIAPMIIRIYSLSFVLLPFNVFSTYYFQSIMQPKVSFVISILRGAVVSGGLIMLLPLIFTADALWYSMLITEILISLLVIIFIKKAEKI